MGEKLNTVGGFCVAVEDEELVRKRESRDLWPASKFHARRHRRSRSASEKKEDISQLGLSRSGQDNLNVARDSPAFARGYGIKTPHQHFLCSSSDSSNHRASLEKDTERYLPFSLRQFPVVDIHLLRSRLDQERSMRIMLERAIGRASSTLSPGHRHFSSQTKELVAEIELLEEEVANREQHVLSLYRSIFEKRASRPASEQSSGVSSPVHVKTKARKHPSIISSAFCSSKKFPLHPFQALSSRSGSGRKTCKTGHASVPVEGPRAHLEKMRSSPVKVQAKSIPTALDKSSMVRTLKEHLFQCPSKLSEEMVRCMASVYCWLLNTTSQKLESDQSSDLSKSSENSVPLQLCVEEEKACKPMIEICSIPTHRNQCSRASYAINNYRVLVEQLERVNVSQMEIKSQLAFWINVYNSLIMHAYLAYGIPNSSLRRFTLFHKAAYNIGGHVISANAIEHAIFCFRTHRIGGWLEAILSTAMWKKSGEEKQIIGSRFGLPSSRSLVCFALCNGAVSDPVLKVYTASNVKDELESARREFLQANIVVKKSRKVFLPKLLEKIAKEASISTDDLLKYVCDNVDKKLRDSIQKCLESKANKKASQIVDWLPYSTKFRYIFSKELAAKPWWL